MGKVLFLFMKGPNVLTSQEDVQEDFGWKLVHGEVFRTPVNPLILSVIVGNGAQLCAMAGVTLGKSNELFTTSSADLLFLFRTVFALLGFLSPSNRGSLATVMIVCWTFFGRLISDLHKFHFFVSYARIVSEDISLAESMRPWAEQTRERIPS